MRRAWGCPPTAPVAGAGFPPFPDSAAGAFAFNGVGFQLPSWLLIIVRPHQRDAEVLTCETKRFRQHFFTLTSHLGLAG